LQGKWKFYIVSVEEFMKYLVLVRHGDYENSILTERGRKQAEELGAILREKIDGISIVLSSTLSRARETSLILARHLLGDEEFRVYSCFGPSNGHRPDKEVERKALELVEEYGLSFDAVVISTHWEFATFFPFAWGRRLGINVKLHPIPPGAAYFIDVMNGIVEVIQPDT
jgi:hypothetical protein